MQQNQSTEPITFKKMKRKAGKKSRLCSYPTVPQVGGDAEPQRKKVVPRESLWKFNQLINSCNATCIVLDWMST